MAGMSTHHALMVVERNNIGGLGCRTAEDYNSLVRGVIDSGDIIPLGNGVKMRYSREQIAALDELMEYIKDVRAKNLSIVEGMELRAAERAANADAEDEEDWP